MFPAMGTKRRGTLEGRPSVVWGYPIKDGPSSKLMDAGLWGAGEGSGLAVEVSLEVDVTGGVEITQARKCVGSMGYRVRHMESPHQGDSQGRKTSQGPPEAARQEECRDRGARPPTERTHPAAPSVLRLHWVMARWGCNEWWQARRPGEEGHAVGSRFRSEFRTELEAPCLC